MGFTINEVNRMDQNQFVQSIGVVFEHSPWVAKQSWKYHPFASLKELYEMMIREMYHAENAMKLSLLRAHPDLGTRLVISESSKQEQSGAGLNELSEEEFLHFSSLNKQYVERFGFPFIMAVKGQNKTKIQQQMELRISNSYDEEMDTALKEVSKIVKFRLEDLISEKTETRG
ncbi:2-oxo-4-hydroxy-4-carboxy-5-ureidoimidazoline decarboxylase [Evansella tamaricis]|uniref:2-oxo-4-hydroxy-4-carboxy-5-ureidoimidazoline decarboxylase n=1 Tax=Evansella tamaricis TaxID=2069301 RepID=A0ABS6JJP8_9BACI|nr:2-oxo-4-hydroxy-4-carboxy-5-ureidoimidazoline decarboxylase [Evansella tamaricis]MBU9713912.1 2-oxo-4-hydroxy-4-carboxy-5-ureidoimidazoline decarboxylase [Evansella tamaricis]